MQMESDECRDSECPIWESVLPIRRVLRAEMECEFRTISLVQQKAKTPIPKVHALEVNSDCMA